MTSELPEAEDDVKAQIQQLLSDAKAHVSEIDGEGETDDGELKALRDVGDRANEVVSAVSAADLLAAVGSDAAADEKAPATIPEAIQQSDPKTVLRLRKLLVLARMGEAEGDDTLFEHVEKFREISSFEASASPAVDRSGSNETREPNEDSQAETDREAAASAEQNGYEGEHDSGPESSDEGDYTEQIREQFREGIGEFREGIESVRDELQSKAGGESDERDSGSNEGGDDVLRRRGYGTMLSTMPGRNRPDMKRTARLSTVRKNRTDEH